MKKGGLLVALIFIYSCEVIGDHSQANLKTTGIFVVNEGSFLQGNGDVSFYDAEAGVLTNTIFQTANGEPAGDIVQDMVIADSLAILIVNNSNQIRIVGISDFVLRKTIPVAQPRFGALAGPSFVYVSCWDGFVRVLNLATLTVTDSVAVGSYPEDILVHHNIAYVANSGFGYSNEITLINTINHTAFGTLRTGNGPVKIALDHDADRLYVACSGDAYASPKVPGGVYIYRESTRTLLDSIISIGQDTLFTSRVAVSHGRLFLITGYSGNVIVMIPNTHSSVDTIVGNFYNVETNSANPADERVYATTATAPGLFKIFDHTLQEVYSGTVGDFPSGIVFKQE